MYGRIIAKDVSALDVEIVDFWQVIIDFLMISVEESR